MKSNQKNNPRSLPLAFNRLDLSSGFTLIEMLVVIGIMAMIIGLFLVNFNALEGARNLKIAQNQLVTDIRKIQSYTLSSRNVSSSGKPAHYYIIKFDTSTLNNKKNYTIQAIDNASTASVDLQTILLPRTSQISSLSVQPASGSAQTATCVQVAFSLPFGRVFMDYKTDGTACNIANTFQNSINLDQNKNIVLSITLQDASANPPTTKIVEINGISQSIQPK